MSLSSLVISGRAGSSLAHCCVVDMVVGHRFTRLAASYGETYEAG